LVLTMPLIIGGIFGKEAGLASFGGAAEGLMNIYAGREKEREKGEKKLSELEKNIKESRIRQQDIELKKLQAPQEVRKALGGRPNEHLQGMNLVNITDEEGNEKQGVRIKPGLIADIEFVKDKESVNEMKKEALDLNNERNAINKLGENVRDVIEIASKMKDKSSFIKILEGIGKAKKPSVIAKFGEQIDFNGKKVNSAVALTQAIEKILQDRRNVEKIKAFGPQYFEHFERIITNPIGNFTSMRDLIDQVLQLYVPARDLFIQDLENRGFLKEGILDDFYGKDKAIYDFLNKKENIKREQGDTLRRMEEEMEVPNA
jgi:hypothetical protein